MSNFPPSLKSFQDVGAALDAEAELMAGLRDGECAQRVLLWSSRKPALVVPVSMRSSPSFELAVKLSSDRGWPVFVRKTGGGVTPQGPGIINASIGVVPVGVGSLSIAESYRLLCAPIIDELASLSVAASTGSVRGAFCDGAYNVTVEGKKLAGTAQRRSCVRDSINAQALFGHALILFDASQNAGLNAVNRLQQLMGLDEQFSKEAHISVVEACAELDQEINHISFSQRLWSRYEAALQPISTPPVLREQSICVPEGI